MKTAQELVAQSNALVKSYVPKWRTISKERSLLHKIISWLPPIIFFRKDYLENFWTTVGFTAAHPIGQESDWDTIPHEGVHGRQALRWTRLFFGFLYLFPQSLLIPLVVILSLLYSPWLWLGMLIAAAPLPAPFRAWWELEAYKVSVMIWEWQWARNTDEIIDNIIKGSFAGPSYYFMMPFTGWVKKELEEARRQAVNWRFVADKDPYLNDVFNLLREGGRLARKYQ